MYHKYGNVVFSVKVNKTVDVGSHTIFIGNVTEQKVLSEVPSASYRYYFGHVSQPKIKKDDMGAVEEQA